MFGIAVVFGLRWDGKNLFQVSSQPLPSPSQVPLPSKLRHGDRVRFGVECGAKVRRSLVFGNGGALGGALGD